MTATRWLTSLACGRYWTTASTFVDTPSLVDVDVRRMRVSTLLVAGRSYYLRVAAIYDTTDPFQPLYPNLRSKSGIDGISGVLVP